MGCAQGKCCLPRHPRRGAADATLGRAAVPSAGLVLEYAALEVAGLYPDSSGRESQDAHLVATHFAGDPDLHFLPVFDHESHLLNCSLFTMSPICSTHCHFVIDNG